MTTIAANSAVLGPLCKRGHNYQKTGQSLRWPRSRSCVECAKINQRKWKETPQGRIRSKEILRASRLKTKYKMTIEEYEKRLQKQKGTCGICGRKPTSAILLAVDHCHTTGKIRGLLCTQCNQALGQLQEDPFLFERAAQYIRDGDFL